MMELQLYNLSLLVVGVLNLAMAMGLLVNNYAYRHYPVYRRSCLFTAVFFAVFGIGMLLHYHFQWRMSYPLFATALSVSYFHIAGVAITWSHTSLLNPKYLCRKVVVRDVTFLAVGLTAYWSSAIHSSLTTLNNWLLLFLVHAVWMTINFYTTYYRVRSLMVTRHLDQFSQGHGSYSLFSYHHSLLLSCHLIIAFGIGSMVFTSLLPLAIWPYTVLLCMGGAVFAYVYYSISEYGSVIDPATNAAEDVVNQELVAN